MKKIIFFVLLGGLTYGIYSTYKELALIKKTE